MTRPTESEIRAAVALTVWKVRKEFRAEQAKGIRDDDPELVAHLEATGQTELLPPAMRQRFLQVYASAPRDPDRAAAYYADEERLDEIKAALPRGGDQQQQ